MNTGDETTFSEGSAWYGALERADQVLLLAGTVLFVASMAHWLLRRRTGLLDRIALETEGTQLEGLLVPVFVWAVAVGLVGTSGLVGEGAQQRSPALYSLVGHIPLVAAGVACVWIGGRMTEGGTRRFLFGRASPIGHAASGLGYFLSSMAICPVAYYGTLYVILKFQPAYQVIDHNVIQDMRAGGTPAWAIWIGTTLIVPICEELFFRGILQSTLVKVFRSRWLAVFAAGAVFGFVHAGGGDSPTLHVVPALSALGVLLGVLYLRSGSLIGPVVLHALFNAKTLLWQTLLLIDG